MQPQGRQNSKRSTTSLQLLPDSSSQGGECECQPATLAADRGQLGVRWSLPTAALPLGHRWEPDRRPATPSSASRGLLPVPLSGTPFRSLTQRLLAILGVNIGRDRLSAGSQRGFGHVSATSGAQLQGHAGKPSARPSRGSTSCSLRIEFETQREPIAALTATVICGGGESE